MQKTKPIWPVDLPGIIGRITPEDGVLKGGMRPDWDEICNKAAAHFHAVLPEIKARMKGKYPKESIYSEYARQSALVEAIAYRNRLLDEPPQPAQPPQQDGETT